MTSLKLLVITLALATPALAETILPDGVTEFIRIPPTSPLPQLCRPINADANLLVLSPKMLLPIFDADGVEDFFGVFEYGFIDLSGFFLVDANSTGRPEAYGFGTARSDMGGGYPSHGWINNNGEQIDLREGKYSENFSQGLLLDERYRGDGLPTLVINLSEWTCSIAMHPNGDVPAD